MESIFHIAISCNERYVSGALEALAGVAVHAKMETQLIFHVFTESVKPESIEFMRKTLARLHANSRIEQHVCDEALLTGLPYWAGSRMAAVRCFYADLMPEVDWCLYLDCDVLYLASVEEHFSYKDDSVYACVVQEESAGTRQSECEWIAANCGVEIPDDKYFNSGVMLFNFAKMRKDGIPSKLLQFFSDHPDVPSPDQDALNATFAGYVKMLPPKFDRLQIYLTDEKFRERPVIHYVSGNPWRTKLSAVANCRFRLWHKFADVYIWERPGESYRRCFPKSIYVLKLLSYWLLKAPILWRLFVFALGKFRISSNAREWRQDQISFDISSSSLEAIF